MSVSRVSVLGVPVDCVDMQRAVAVVDQMVRGNRCELVLAVNPEKAIAARQNPLLLATLQQAGLLIPDGIGVVLAARLLGGRRITRVPGADLMPALCKLAAERGYAVYLYGAASQTNSAAVEVLRKRFPSLKIAGHAHEFHADDDVAGTVEDINRSGADILFVALGSPKQERWMSQHRDDLRVKVCQGVGGKLRRARRRRQTRTIRLQAREPGVAIPSHQSAAPGSEAARSPSICVSGHEDPAAQATLRDFRAARAMSLAASNVAAAAGAAAEFCARRPPAPARPAAPRPSPIAGGARSWSRR